MIASDCPDCGEPVPTLAKSCPHCGVPNPARRAGIVVAASLVVLIAAIGVAIFAVVRWQRLPVEPSTAVTTEDFGWLTAAMNDCDTDAAGSPSTLHFLVIPLASSPADDPEWRKKSLNAVGNAILLPADDALEALKEGDLKISTNQYVFA